MIARRFHEHSQRHAAIPARRALLQANQESRSKTDLCRLPQAVFFETDMEIWTNMEIVIGTIVGSIVICAIAGGIAAFIFPNA